MKNPVNFFMVGAEKSGTTWFYYRLREHPEVFLPSAKEIGYFNSKNSEYQDSKRYQEQSEATYLKNYLEFNDEKICGEIMPMYLCDKDAPSRIHKFAPQSKILISLRNPIDRAYSHYWMVKGKEDETRSFGDVVDEADPRIIERGLYADQVMHYMDLFGRENVHVIFYEEFFSDPQEQLERVCDFLGISYEWFGENPVNNDKENAANTIRNLAIYKFGILVSNFLRRTSIGIRFIGLLDRSGIKKRYKRWIWKDRKYEAISDADRSTLMQYYLPDFEKLKSVIGRELPW